MRLRERVSDWVFWCAFIAIYVMQGALVAAVVYVAAHFISKYW